MDIIIDSSFSGIYLMKSLRFCAAWLAIYLVRRFFSTDYIDSTVIGNKRPQRLSIMIRNFAFVALLMEGFIHTCMLIVAHAKDAKGRSWVRALGDPGFATAYALDTICTFLLTVTLSYIVARVIGDNTVFQYVDQGPRAARTLEEIVVNIAAIVYLIPFFLIV